jgi:hypothetical protein
MNMNFRKVLLMAGIVTMVTLLVPSMWVWAGGGDPGGNYQITPIDPNTVTFTGPELCGVCIMDCSLTNPVGMLRVKRIVDCNVETTALKAIFLNCPTDSSELINKAFTGTDWPHIFGITQTPVIRNIKNWKKEGDIVSFDFQLNFY